MARPSPPPCAACPPDLPALGAAVAPGAARGLGPRPGAAPPWSALGVALLPGVRSPQPLPARRARRVRPPRRAPLHGHGARARPRHPPRPDLARRYAQPGPGSAALAPRPRRGRGCAASLRRAHAASPAAQLPAPPRSAPPCAVAATTRRGASAPAHGARRARPACARPPRVPRRDLELGPACLWHAALSSASARPARSASACARPVRDASARPCTRVLAWCARCFGTAHCALDALVYP
jgi:hypothetical protein